MLEVMLTARASAMRFLHVYERMGDIYITPRLLRWMLKLLELKGHVYRQGVSPTYYCLTPAGIEMALTHLKRSERDAI